jgi:hypothetical protein
MTRKLIMQSDGDAQKDSCRNQQSIRIRNREEVVILNKIVHKGLMGAVTAAR